MTFMWNTMKTFIFFAVALSVAYAETSPSASASTSGSDSTSKAEAKNANSIPLPPQKQQAYYTPILHRPPYSQYIQQKQPYYLPTQQAQPAMVIIAQPALVPHHMIYSQAAQQLLQYFQSNPQARYQFLHGYPPQHQTQQTAHSYASPQLAQIPYQSYVGAPPVISAPQHVAFAHSPFTALPANYFSGAQAHTHVQAQAQTQSYPQIQAYAQAQSYPQIQAQAQTYPQIQAQTQTYPQIQAQAQSQTYTQVPASSTYAQQYSSQTSSLKTAPPIITGFENFTPEQQAQIKEQLSSHFGTSLTQLTGNSLQVPSTSSNSQYGTKLAESSEGKQDAQAAQTTSSNYYRSQYAKQQ